MMDVAPKIHRRMGHGVGFYGAGGRRVGPGFLSSFPRRLAANQMSHTSKR